MNVFIYDWGTRHDFLLWQLYSTARRVLAPPGGSLDRMVQELRDLGRAPSVWFFHVNVSFSKHWVPRRMRSIAALEAMGCRVVNGSVMDTRKSTVQRTNRALGLPDVIVTADGNPQTKVIVKTDYNYGGICEGQLSEVELNRLGLLPVEGCRIRSFDDYFVCRLGNLDEDIWRDERLVVERYIENRANLLCRFYRCGSRAVLSEVVNRSVVKKMVPGLPRRNWCFDFYDEGPRPYRRLVADVTRLCEALGLEFGALDILIDEDRCPYIVDVNPTPGWGLESQDDVTTFLRCGF